MKLVTYLFVALCSLILIAGCGRKSQEKISESVIKKAIEKQSGGKAKVDLSEGSISIQTEEGSFQMSSGESAKIPDNFPSDVYVFEGAKIEAVMQSTEGSTLSLSTQDTISKVTGKYRSEMTNKGWKQESTINMGDQQMLLFTKDERASTVIVTSDGEKTMIAMTVANK